MGNHWLPWVPLTANMQLCITSADGTISGMQGWATGQPSPLMVTVCISIWVGLSIHTAQAYGRVLLPAPCLLSPSAYPAWALCCRQHPLIGWTRNKRFLVVWDQGNGSP